MEAKCPNRQTKNIDSEDIVKDVSDFIGSEFCHYDFGDKRLTDRLKKIAVDLGSASSKSIPDTSEDWASTKVVYRFTDNPKVNHMEILSSHHEEIKSRLDRSSLDKILCVSDTTNLTYLSPLSTEGLGDIGDSKTDVGGVLVHSTLGIDPNTGKTLGLLDQQVLIQDQSQDPTATYDTNRKGELKELESRQVKWIRVVKQTMEWIPEETRPVFVFDRGGDDFTYYQELKEEKAGFIIRAS